MERLPDGMRLGQGRLGGEESYVVQVHVHLASWALGGEEVVDLRRLEVVPYSKG